MQHMVEDESLRRKRLKDAFRSPKSSGREGLIYGIFLLVLYLLIKNALLRPVIITLFASTLS